MEFSDEDITLGSVWRALWGAAPKWLVALLTAAAFVCVLTVPVGILGSVEAGAVFWLKTVMSVMCLSWLPPLAREMRRARTNVYMATLTVVAVCMAGLMVVIAHGIWWGL